MNQRTFAGTGVAAGLYPTGSEIPSPALRVQQLGEKNDAANPMPAWLTEKPIVMAGCWDDFPLFQIRRGGEPIWIRDAYRKQRDPRTIEALAKAGVTLGMIHFFKGFGLHAEHEHIEDARILSRLLKLNGIRVGLYVGGTICYETFLLEEPQAEEWFAPDFMGKPLYYGDQTFRRRVYFMHPGYRAYIKRVLKYGIENLDADLFHFDNTPLQARPEIFQHPMASENFRDYLTAKYSPAELKTRLGFSDIHRVVAPDIENVPSTIDDPLFQEWARFRCHQLTSYFAEMRSYIRSLNESVAIDNNPAYGISGHSLIWEQGIDYPHLLDQVDVAWTEEGDVATVTPEGILVSKIRTLKAASRKNRSIFCYTWGAGGGHWGYEANRGGILAMAESMAFNRQCLGMVGDVNAIADLPSKPRQYIRFFHDNFHLYRSVAPIADVALLSSFASMGFNLDRPVRSFLLAGQTLIQSRFLFDIIFDQDLEELSKYRALFLADQECLSDRQIKLIRNFVMNGGGLVASEHTSLYNDRRERRRNFGLKDLFGVSDPPLDGSSSPETLPGGGLVRNRAGKGQVVYISEITPSTSRERAPGVKSNQNRWPLPANHCQIQNAVSTALQGKATLRMPGLASPYVTAELVSQSAEDRLILHLLNYNYAKDAPLRNLPISIAIPGDKSVKRIQALSPDRPDRVTEIGWKRTDSITFTVPSLEIYTIVVCDLKKE